MAKNKTRYLYYQNPDTGRHATIDTDLNGKVAIIFEGGIKNYASIKDAKDDLLSRGYEYQSSR